MKLYNTLSRQSETLKPLDGNTVKLYTCGHTVYNQPHIGNWLAYIYWDILDRTLRAEGYVVERTQNITDVGHLVSDDDDGEDKMEKGARREGITAWNVAERYISIVNHEAYDILGFLPPKHLSRATDYISQQIDFAKILDDKDYLYAINGDGMYFDTSKLDDYGKLAKLDVEGLEAGSRVSAAGKRNPTDFAIWKFSPADSKRDMEWESPWGKGFPGWHLECSVIARETLGDQIDIHTGGIDHIPVHHTNEIAQTESLTGKQFAQLWAHNNHIKIDGTKISKSLGNIYTLKDIVDQGYHIDAFKLLAYAKHYRTEGNFSWEILDAAQQRLKRWQAVAELRWQTNDTLEDDSAKDSAHDTNAMLLSAPHAALESLADDLNIPKALIKLERAFEAVDNTPIRALQQSAIGSLVRWIDQTLGLKLEQSTPDITDEQKKVILSRIRAREQKDWQQSDALRDELASQGLHLKDTGSNTLWTRT